MEYIFTIDIGGTSIKYGIIDGSYNIKKRGELQTPYKDAPYLIDFLTQIIEEEKKKFFITGVAVSLPGGVSKDEDGVVYRGGQLTYLHLVPFGRLIRERVQLPCTVENDGRCGVLGEYQMGALKGVNNGVVIVLGTSVGGGVVLNGEILEGANDFGGHFAQILTTYSTETKSYGAFGIENGRDFLKHLVLQAKELPQDMEVDGHQIFQWVNEGDTKAIQGLQEFCRMLAVQITNLQVILDPEVIALGGGISSQPILLEMVKEELFYLYDASPLERPYSNVVLAEQGNDANLFGAVSVWMKKYKKNSAHKAGGFME